MWDQLRAWFGLERRDLTLNDPALQRLYGGGGGPASGEAVSVQRAVGASAVWACVTLIAGSIASMPLILYRREEDGRARAVEHPLFDVLRVRPNPISPVVTFWESLVTSLLLRGNGYAQITRDDDARVRALWYVNPDHVTVDVTKTGKLTYKVATPSGQTRVAEGGMLHITGPMADNGVQGRSVISTFRETLGLGLALEQYGGEFFRNAATPKGVLSHPRVLGATARERLLESMAVGHTGQGKRHRTILLEEGMTWTALGVSHEDSQFIESRRFTVEEIARVFGVPAAMIGGEAAGTMTYANAETRALDFLKFCLGPWLSRIESAVNFACISPLERRQLYVEFLPDAILATDTMGRYQAYTLGLAGGWLTLDEIRRAENRPALPTQVPADD